MSHPAIPVVCLVGGIGSGKSALARMLAERFDGAILDADRAGHAALRRSDVKRALREQFGPEIFDAAGEVDRPRLAREVFGADVNRRHARQALEAIVHPVIRESLAAEAAAIRQEGRSRLILLDAAIALEAGWSELCDLLVYIDVPREVRLQRIQDNRRWSEEDLLLREASQWSLERKRAGAEEVVDNSGPIESAANELQQILVDRFQLTPNATELVPVPPDSGNAWSQ